MVKNPPANAGDIRDAGSAPGSGISPGEGHGNPLNSCLENPMDRETWQATVHATMRLPSRTCSDLACTHACIEFDVCISLRVKKRLKIVVLGFQGTCLPPLFYFSSQHEHLKLHQVLTVTCLHCCLPRLLEGKVHEGKDPIYFSHCCVPRAYVMFGAWQTPVGINECTHYACVNMCVVSVTEMVI